MDSDEQGGRVVVRGGKCVSHTNMVPYVDGKRARPWTKIEKGKKHTLAYRPTRSLLDWLLRRPARPKPRPGFREDQA